MDPILNGAPGFILLTFVVALAAFLRQVSVNAQDRIEQIEANKHPAVWPVLPTPAEHTRERLDSLRNTKRGIELVAHPLFFLIVAVALRTVLYALSRIPSSDAFLVQFASAEWLRLIDLALMILVSMFMCAMWVMYGLAKVKEKRALRKLNAWRETQRSTEEAAAEKGDGEHPH